jgi:hypothetical protein
MDGTTVKTIRFISILLGLEQAMIAQRASDRLPRLDMAGRAGILPGAMHAYGIRQADVNM